MSKHQSSALVLDFGGPVLLTPFELTSRAEQRLGLPPGSLPWRGPFDVDSDRAWRDVLAGELSERQYWADRADEFGALTGRPATTRELIGALYEGAEDVLVRPGAVQLMRDCRQAGVPVGILTNDLGAFHSPQWVDALQVLHLADAMVDGSHTGILKPDPRSYHAIAEQLHVDVADVVFLDDQPVNLAGAVAVGMQAVHVDVTAPGGSFEHARALLGLASPRAWLVNGTRRKGRATPRPGR